MRLPVCLLFALSCMPAVAAGLDQLNNFLARTHTARGTFTQIVIARSGRPQASSGTFSLARPGKFRWTYEKPFEQLLVGDGKKFWSYDRDLNQVTVRKVGDAVGSSPAALLAGEALEKNFDLKEGGNGAGEDSSVEFIDARPKAQDATFQSVRLGFQNGQPRVMEIHDNFGQTTLLRFTRFEPNPALGPNEFQFTPPKGADVVGE